MTHKSSADFTDLDLFEWTRRHPEEQERRLSRLRVALMARLCRIEKRVAQNPHWFRDSPVRHEDDEVVSGEAARPFATRMATAERRRREEIEQGWKWEQATALEWLRLFGEDALWMPEFWSFVADLSAVSSHDPAAGVRRQNDREPKPFRIEGTTLALIRSVEATLSTQHRDELDAIAAKLKGSRRAGCPLGTKKTATKTRKSRAEKARLTLEQFEERLEVETFRDPVGASARAVAFLAKRHQPKPVTPSAIQKLIRLAKQERREGKPI